jgi:hypothetical protein
MAVVESKIKTRVVFKKIRGTTSLDKIESVQASRFAVMLMYSYLCLAIGVD